MRDVFPGYYSLTDDEFDRLWESGLVVLDSSALLSLFRYSVPTSAQFIEALRAKSNQLWIPRQVGIEFQRNRDVVIRTQHDALNKIERAIQDAHGKTESAIREFKRHPSLATGEMLKVVKKNRQRLDKSLANARRRHDELVESPGANDATFDAISELYESRVGQLWSDKALEALYKEGAGRFERKAPPGYEDKKNKQEPDMYGDLVIWRQILEHAEMSATDVLFVTDDVKEDWWWIVEGKLRGARPELVAEFVEQVGKHVAFVTPDRFLEIAQKRGAEITNEAVQEVKANTQEAKSNTHISVAAAEDTIRILTEAASSTSEKGRKDLIAALDAMRDNDPAPLRSWLQSDVGQAAIGSGVLSARNLASPEGLRLSMTRRARSEALTAEIQAMVERLAARGEASSRTDTGDPDVKDLSSS